MFAQEATRIIGVIGKRARDRLRKERAKLFKSGCQCDDDTVTRDVSKWRQVRTAALVTRGDSRRALYMMFVAIMKMSISFREGHALSSKSRTQLLELRAGRSLIRALS